MTIYFFIETSTIAFYDHLLYDYLEKVDWSPLDVGHSSLTDWSSDLSSHHYDCHFEIGGDHSENRDVDLMIVLHIQSCSLPNDLFRRCNHCDDYMTGCRCNYDYTKNFFGY